MSTDKTRERLEQLEHTLRASIPLRSPADIDAANAAIHRHTIHVAREAHAACLADWNIGGLCPPEDPDVYRRRLAAKVYPLPPKRELREEPDPNDGEVFWRWNARLEYRTWNATVWVALASDCGMRVFSPSPERIDLWHSLKHKPYREVPDEGDE